MTTLQLRRWQVFSLRMARYAMKGTAKRKERMFRECAWVFKWLRTPQCRPQYIEVNRWEDCGDDIEEDLWNSGYFRMKNGDRFGNFGNDVLACMRSGFDVAVEQSAGVVGFTVADVKAMWPDKPMPDWVNGGWCFGEKDRECITTLTQMKDEEVILL